eukprot:1140357-Pelagomonas_calceolata.AAC.7
MQQGSLLPAGAHTRDVLSLRLHMYTCMQRTDPYSKNKAMHSRSRLRATRKGYQTSKLARASPT